MINKLSTFKENNNTDQTGRQLSSFVANSPYLDYIANPLTNVPFSHQPPPNFGGGQFSNVKQCPGWFVLGCCETGHHWAKEIYCGREWCENCREPSHDRRFGRLLPKVQQLKSMGYLVVTFPPEDRAGMRTKAALVEIGKVVGWWVKAMFTRGVKRWHFFGKDGLSYHPHLNFLVDGARLEKRSLEGLRRGLKLSLNLSQEPVINYHYSQRPARMVHWLKYITRATFLEYQWDPELAEELWNFRNITWWGKWDGEPVWDLSPNGESDQVEQLEQGLCPECGKPIKWDKAIPIEWLKLWGGEAVGAGYHRVRCHDSPT